MSLLWWKEMWISFAIAIVPLLYKESAVKFKADQYTLLTKTFGVHLVIVLENGLFQELFSTPSISQGL